MSIPDHKRITRYIPVPIDSLTRVIAMEENNKDIEEMLRGVDFTKGSSHKKRLRDKLFSADSSDELELSELSNVRAALKKDAGFDIPGEQK